MKSGRYKHFRRKDSEETVVVDNVVVDNVVVDSFVVDTVVVVVVIFSLLKQLFWQPSKQQRPKGSCGSLVGQSISFVPGDQQIGFLSEAGQTLSPSASTWGQEFSCKAIEIGIILLIDKSLRPEGLENIQCHLLGADPYF